MIRFPLSPVLFHTHETRGTETKIIAPLQQFIVNLTADHQQIETGSLRHADSHGVTKKQFITEKELFLEISTNQSTMPLLDVLVSNQISGVQCTVQLHDPHLQHDAARVQGAKSSALRLAGDPRCDIFSNGLLHHLLSVLVSSRFPKVSANVCISVPVM